MDTLLHILEEQEVNQAHFQMVGSEFDRIYLINKKHNRINIFLKDYNNNQLKTP